ncbi:hypothetical protein [Lentzea sp. NPDC004782]|uniref:hypothetical protein n=1 Tax=Lentzea sp. NPDC004782 TaxID=3154458 RepID=UPI0033BFAFD2
MTLISPLVNPNRAGGERSVSPADPHVCERPGERSAENLWSTIRHHTSSWSLLWRLLVLVVGIVAAAAALRWLHVPTARTASAR